MSTGSTIVPTTTSITSQSKAMAVEVYKPAAPGKYPAIVIAHGTDGISTPWGSQIGAFAAFLAGNGYVAMIPHYFDTTGTVPGLATVFASFASDRDVWVKAINDTLVYAAGLSTDVQAGKLALLGFSLGGHLVLRDAIFGSAFQSVAAVVDFFAPISSKVPPYSILDGISGGIAAMPPVQILHGDDDVVVSPDQSRDLVAMLKAAGKTEGIDFVVHFYPGEGHGFHLPADVTDSMDRTLKFFNAHVK